MKQTMIELTEIYVYEQLKSDASGHDWFISIGFVSWLYILQKKKKRE